MEIETNVSQYLISLLRSVIRDEKAPEKSDDVPWEDLLRLAVYHSVDEIAYRGIEKLSSRPEGELWDRWNKQHQKNQIVDIVQREESDEIIKRATSEGIKILPIKGIVIKNFYPDSGFRQMGDFDCLVEKDQIDMMRPMMEQLGYNANDVGLEDSHDVYGKPPYMEVEVHRRLLPPTEENHWYTDDIWDRLIPDDDNPNLMHMTLEDIYLFHLLHFEKHYSMGGSGIKSIVDEYYLLEKYEDKLDWDYINEILPKMNYVEFEDMCRRLSQAWFGDGEMTEDLKEPAEFIINSGAFGTFEQYQKWSYERYQREQGIKTKRGFFFRRMFMERERMEFIYPSLKKYPWLLPFCWVHRLFRAVLFNRDRVKLEMDNFKEKDK